MKRIYLFILFSAVGGLIAVPTVGKPGSGPGTNGSYDIVFSGSFSGTGKLVIGGGKITVFKGTLVDSDGVKGSLDVPSLPIRLDDGRFNATVTAMGKSAALCGRVEPADGKIIKKARLVCAFSTGPGNGTKGFGCR